MDVDTMTADIVSRLKAKMVPQVSCKDLEQLLDDNFKLNDQVWSIMQQAWDCAVRLDCQLAETDRPSVAQNSFMQALSQHGTELSIEKAEVDAEILQAKLMVQEAYARAGQLLPVKLLLSVFQACLQVRSRARTFGERIEEMVSAARERLRDFGEPPSSGASTLLQSQGVTKRWRESFVEIHDANSTLLRALQQDGGTTSLPLSTVEEICEKNWRFILELVGLLEKVITKEKERQANVAAVAIEADRLHKQLEERLMPLLDLKRRTLEATACGVAQDISSAEKEIAAAQKAVKSTWKFLTDKNIDLTDIVPTKFVEEMLPHPAAFRSAVALVDEEADSQDVFYPGLVRVLTYSLFLRAPRFSLGLDDDYKDERLQRFLQQMDHYDLVLLQEVAGVFSSRREQMLTSMAAQGFNRMNCHASDTDIWPTFLFDSGLLLMSRLPMVHKAEVKFLPGIHLDRLWARGALYAKLRLGQDGPFMHVCTTQFQSTASEENFSQACDVRRAQIAELTSKLKKIIEEVDGGSRQWPLLLGGNLNVNGRRSSVDSTHSAEYCCLVDLLQDELGTLRDLLHDSCGAHPVTYADVRLTGRGEVPAERVLTAQVAQENNFFQRQRLDYLFFFPQAGHCGERIVPATCRIEKFLIDRTKDIGAPITQLSDHYGVEATVTVIEPALQNPDPDG